MDDDLNSPVLISYLFEGVKIINSANDGTEKLTESDLVALTKLFSSFVFDILGLMDETSGAGTEKLTDDLMKIIINLRQDAKNRKEWGVSDKIRDDLKNAGIALKDLKEGADWSRE
jgi:cysteinyl-tRNA synthetase